jgi:hypothetical protein
MYCLTLCCSTHVLSHIMLQHTCIVSHYVTAHMYCLTLCYSTYCLTLCYSTYCLTLCYSTYCPTLCYSTYSHIHSSLTKLLLFVSRSSYINICGNRYQNRDFGRHVPYFIEKETHNLLDTVVNARHCYFVFGVRMLYPCPVDWMMRLRLPFYGMWCRVVW